MWVLLKTMLRAVLHMPLTNGDRFRMKSDEEIADAPELLESSRYSREREFVEECCKKCPVQLLKIESEEVIELHPCDFEEGECPHGNALLWWLRQPAED